MNILPVRTPSAWIPVALSLAALTLVVGHAAMFGVVHEADEGAAAHIFQILMAAQVPVVAFFALRWVPRHPREGLRVLALQGFAVLLAFAAVYWLT